MKVMIHQPNYLPWRGFFEKARAVDRVVLLDGVGFSKGGFTNRTRMRSSGELPWHWMTVPVRQRVGQPINRVRIEGHSWRLKHLATIRQAYKRSARWEGLGGQLALIYGYPKWEKLAELNLALLGEMFEAFGITVPVVTSTSLGARGSRSALLVDICRRVGADVYVSGGSGPRYLDEAMFDRAGIEVEVVTFTPDLSPPLTALDDYFEGRMR